MADGGLATDRRGPPGRAVRREPGRHGLVHPHRGLAWRRRARPSRPLGRDPLLPRRVRGRGQRVPRGPSERPRPVVRGRRSPRGPGHRPGRPASGALDAGRHPHLGQGPGLGPGRQPGQRDLPDAGRCPAGRSRAHGPAVPGLRPRPARHRGPGGPGGDHSPDPDGDHSPDPGANEHRRGERDPRRPRLDRAGPDRERHPGPRRPGPRDGPGRQGRCRIEQLGRGPVALGNRRRPPRQRPAPRLQHAVGLVRQRPALPAHLGRLPVRRRGRHLPGHPGRDRRPQRPHRVGRDQRQPRRPGPRRGEGAIPPIPRSTSPRTARSRSRSAPRPSGSPAGTTSHSPFARRATGR